ncbi:MAG: ABC transporter permease [Hyphomicrobiales bacterium]|nr:ABC transporter permease [Hyphomicrobiales bacterium]MDE2115195.1 ABC transporter permease [Hyphomicrobiales bacterium]
MAFELPKVTLTLREAPSRLRTFLGPILAFGIAMLLGGLLVALMGKSPWQALDVYFIHPLLDSYNLQALALKASPLVLMAIGLSYCYRANLWNIGAEGQFVIGGTCAGAIAIFTHGAPDNTLWILPAMLLAGVMGGMVTALIPAILKVSLGVSEILTSLMLVYVSQLTLDYLVRGPWRDPKGFNFPVTVTFDPAATLPPLFDGARVHVGVLLTLAIVIIAAIMQGRSLFNFAVRLLGLAPRAARFAGFSEARITLIVFALSGGLAGLAGFMEVSGQINQLQPSISPGYGFTAIIVAFLGRLSPVGILVAGFVLSLTYIGGEAAQISMQLPLDMTQTFQGLLLFCILSADILTRYDVSLAKART